MDKIYMATKKCIVSDYPYDLDWNDEVLYKLFIDTYNAIIEEHSHINNSYYSDDEGGKLMLNYLDHYAIFCFRFAKRLHKEGLIQIADATYYSMRIRCSIDLYYTSNIGECFMPVHALGTIMDSHAIYGRHFKIYDGCHIGPYSIVGKEPKEWVHPTFGDYVTMLAHSTVYGNSVIGNNVIISAGTNIINEEIPDNCIVSGSSPNLVFQKLRISNKSIRKE